MTVWFAGRKRGAVMGLWTTNYQVGSLIANPIAAFFAVAFLAAGRFAAAFFAGAFLAADFFAVAISISCSS